MDAYETIVVAPAHSETSVPFTDAEKGYTPPLGYSVVSRGETAATTSDEEKGYTPPLGYCIIA